VAAWIMEALKDDYELTVLTWDRADLAALDRFYGTSLDGSNISWIYPNPVARAFLNLDPDPESIQPIAYLMRYCRKLRDGYDLVMGASMAEMDLGGPGLLYVHHPDLSRFWPAFRDCHDLSFGAQMLSVLKGSTRPWMVLAGYSVNRMKQNTVLTNSNWTASVVGRSYGIPARTLYPPVTAPVWVRPWEERENGFVCVGRWHSIKRIDWAIAALSKVRGRHSGVSLHLAGTRGKTAPERACYANLVKIAASNDWIHLHESLSRERLLELLGRVRYGIHAREGEHFGIAPAEMLLAECIPFVHNSGGQVEIVGQDARLCFNTPDEAASKIAAVMADSTEQRSILDSLAPLRNRFHAAQFVRNIREAVRYAIQNREVAARA